MKIFFQSETAIRMTAVRLRIRLYNSNGLYEAANPCTFLVGSPVLGKIFSYSVQIFSSFDHSRHYTGNSALDVRLCFRDILGFLVCLGVKNRP